MSKHIHFIGICGVGMGALAIMMKNRVNAKGDAIWKVTGSDVGFYPPISTHLKEHGIEYYAGWHPERIGADPRFRGDDAPTTPALRATPPPAGGDKPDLVVVGNVAGSENPEWKFVQENKIPFVSYPELVARELVRKNSIVCAGTYGKTSTAALLSWILIQAGMNPAYMFGGLSQTPKLASDDLGGEWSVLEGDEYKTSRWDNSPKFSHYSPTHLLLTAVKWDHADVYPTEKKYFEAFEKLVKMIPKNGLIVVSESASPLVISNASEKSSPDTNAMGIPRRPAAAGLARNDNGTEIVTYGRSAQCDYIFSNIIQSPTGLDFAIKYQNADYRIHAGLIGEYQAENICGAFALAHQIGIAPEKIIESIKTFGGIKRRLEKRGLTETGTVVFDDIAHSPAKAKSVLENLQKIYKCHPDENRDLKENKDSDFRRNDNGKPKIFCVFEPNSGNRKTESIPSYKNAFNAADEVIIPRLTKLKNDEEFLSGDQLAEIIKKDNHDTKYIDNDDELMDYLRQSTQAGDVVVFCGSHGFRGMIDELASKQ